MSRLTLSPAALERVAAAMLRTQKDAPAGFKEPAAIAGAVAAASKELCAVINEELSEHLNLLEDALDRITALESALEQRA